MTHSPKSHRALAGMGGGLLLLLALAVAYAVGEKLYYDYYLFPRMKEYYIAPTRWQDLAAIGTQCVAAILMLFFAYRLLRYFRSA